MSCGDRTLLEMCPVTVNIVSVTESRITDNVSGHVCGELSRLG